MSKSANNVTVTYQRNSEHKYRVKLSVFYKDHFSAKAKSVFKLYCDSLDTAKKARDAILDYLNDNLGKSKFLVIDSIPFGEGAITLGKHEEIAEDVISSVKVNIHRFDSDASSVSRGGNKKGMLGDWVKVLGNDGEHGAFKRNKITVSHQYCEEDDD